MFFTSLGRFTVRRRRLVLAFTVLFLVVAGALGSGAFSKLQPGGFDDPNAESTRARAVLEQQFHAGDPNVVLLVHADEGTVEDPAVVAAAGELAAQVQATPGTSGVVSYWSAGNAPPLRSADGRSAVMVARIEGTDSQVADRFTDLRNRVRGDLGAITVQLGGQAAVNHDMTEVITGDLAKAEGISVPITLALLVVVFGGVIAAGLPLVIALVSVLGTFLSLYVLGSITDVSVYSINLTTALGLGLAIDYALFVVTRYREELAHGRTPHDAVVRTVETAGRTVVFSASVVAASLLALLVFPLYFLRSFAYAGISVVVVAALGAVLSLPALLAVLGTRVNKLSIRRRGRSLGQGTMAGAEGTGFWHRLAHGVMRRPVPVAAGTVLLLLVLGAPFVKVNFGLPSTTSLPASIESRKVSETLSASFPSNTGEQFAIVAPAVRPSTAEGGAAVDAFASTLRALPDVADVDVHVAGDTGAWFTVTPSVLQRSAAGEQLVQRIRALPEPDALGKIGVEGSAASLLDTKAAIADHLPMALAIIAIVTFVLLFLVFGSVLVPLKAIVLNLMSLSATFGAMVFVFQWGHGSGLLGFTADGTLDTSMPILMFCIAFGLSMDYEVFLLSRIKEEYDRTGDNTHAVAMGLERTGRIVTAAAALLAITFAAFGLSGVTFIKMFGVGLALAVVMDATVIRGLLVPAFMRLAGRANWWAPAPLRRFHERFGISESGHEAGPGADDEPDQGPGGPADERELVGV